MFSNNKYFLSLILKLSTDLTCHCEKASERSERNADEAIP